MRSIHKSLIESKVKKFRNDGEYFMDKELLDRQFNEALSSKEPSSRVGLFIIGFIGAVTTIVGFICTLIGAASIANSGSEIEVVANISLLIGGLLILCQGASLSLLLVLVKDNRDLKHLVRRVSAGVIKRNVSGPSSTASGRAAPPAPRKTA